MATSQQPSGKGRTSKGKLAAGVVGVLALFGIAGNIGSHPTGTNPASDTHAAATSTSAPRSAEPLRSTYSAPSTSRTTTPPPPPAPTMAMTCPAGGSVASPAFGNQIVAIAPFTVVIDYGDGDVYTNDDQHLGAIFSHTYQRAGTFAVNAVVTDATGRTAAATCTYSWTAPPPPVVRSSSGGTSSGAPGGSGTSDGSGSSSGGGQEVPATGGPTAICNDGTASYSQHRSGTCSHHGGVGQWLV